MKPAVALALCACGSVASEPSKDAPVVMVDARPGDPPPHTLRGHLDATQPVTFGGGPRGFCTYTITLQQLDISLEVQASGSITAGQVQDLNVEAVVGTCTNGPIPPKIATYTFDTAKPGPGGMMLTFQAASTNVPTVALTATVAIVGAAATATLGFKRSGTADPVLDWSVVTPPLSLTTN